ncbi:dodecin family protein [Flagellimonas allohymeniacidonis]|uniref:Dodecin domain-containing protein n=1 Tax=Flagellimonas allohymeniacidonis TaxID=2517819 RepID=A0A4Q8QIA1_9FLAO|nr:dodecin family protein [Allomuricauda hymeniacidonis]TAI48423.1 dodecin domain-containing protein [Allomuricauda hymeniacidonis]
MSVLKVIEILGNSTESFEDAVQNIITEASKTVKDIRSVYIQDMQVTVSDNQISQYRVNAKVTFGIMDVVDN